MLEQTVARLRPLISAERIWSVTNAEQAAALRKQLPAPARKKVLTEPCGRNTAAAIALAAVHIRHAAKGDAVMAVLPADHYIAQPERYRQLVNAALEVARAEGRMVVLGIPPTRPETGYGYIERIEQPFRADGFTVYPVRRFTEKPELDVAKEYVASGMYQWNAGMFFWRVSTFLEALREFLPKTHEALESLAETYRQKQLRISAEDNLSEAGKHFRRLRHPGKRHCRRRERRRRGSRRFRDSRGHWLERYRLLGRGVRTARTTPGRKCSCRARGDISMPTAIFSAARPNLSPPSACMIWWWWKRLTRC